MAIFFPARDTAGLEVFLNLDSVDYIRRTLAIANWKAKALGNEYDVHESIVAQIMTAGAPPNANGS
jgi:hypothetical protein